MSWSRLFVPCPGRARKAAGLLLALASTGTAVGADRRIEPHLSARAYAPGEIVRFEVTTDPGAARLTGTFFALPLSFVKAGDHGQDAVWVGWGVIPLDAPPGGAGYQLTAGGADGSTLSIGGDVPVSAKSFPEQRLDVESKFVNPPKSALARIEREKKTLGEIYARRTSLLPPDAPFVKPVPGEPTSEFGTRRVFNGEPRAPHPGIDLRAPTGTPVLAAGPGRVAVASNLYYSGGTVIIDHGGGLFTIYAHLSKIQAKVGATITEGERVGLSGATGRVTGPHLHWGARVGEAIFDPRALLDPRLFAASSGSGAP